MKNEAGSLIYTTDTLGLCWSKVTNLHSAGIINCSFFLAFLRNSRIQDLLDLSTRISTRLTIWRRPTEIKNGVIVFGVELELFVQVDETNTNLLKEIEKVGDPQDKKDFLALHILKEHRKRYQKHHYQLNTEIQGIKYQNDLEARTSIYPQSCRYPKRPTLHPTFPSRELPKQKVDRKNRTS